MVTRGKPERSDGPVPGLAELGGHRPAVLSAVWAGTAIMLLGRSSPEPDVPEPVVDDALAHQRRGPGPGQYYQPEPWQHE